MAIGCDEVARIGVIDVVVRWLGENIVLAVTPTSKSMAMMAVIFQKLVSFV